LRDACRDRGRFPCDGSGGGGGGFFYGSATSLLFGPPTKVARVVPVRVNEETRSATTGFRITLIRRPYPNRLVRLTFDDRCLSPQLVYWCAHSLPAGHVFVKSDSLSRFVNKCERRPSSRGQKIACRLYCCEQVVSNWT